MGIPVPNALRLQRGAKRGTQCEKLLGREWRRSLVKLLSVQQRFCKGEVGAKLGAGSGAKEPRREREGRTERELRRASVKNRLLRSSLQYRGLEVNEEQLAKEEQETPVAQVRNRIEQSSEPRIESSTREQPHREQSSPHPQQNSTPLQSSSHLISVSLLPFLLPPEPAPPHPPTPHPHPLPPIHRRPHIQKEGQVGPKVILGSHVDSRCREAIRGEHRW